MATNININPSNIDSMAREIKRIGIGLIIVGPEMPLASGIVDYFEKIGIPIFGPNKLAAQIETSKIFAKELMLKYGIPCAKGAIFSNYAEAKTYIEKQTPPIVVKADGLAAGKGVTVAKSIPEALDALSKIMELKIFGAAGDRALVEECLFGKEMSTFVVTDGKTTLPMISACDYKAVFDDNKGPNTGGMGSYSPPIFYNPELAEKISETIMKPVVAAMGEEGRLYKGVLYGGLMITDSGLKVLEFNARFGDPETQVTLPLLETDLIEIILAVIEGRLEQVDIKVKKKACVGVVLASGGYPGHYKRGFPITGLDELDEDILVFQAGTKLDSGHVVTNGGRVLTVVAMDDTLEGARERVYENIPQIHFEGCHYRTDIALFER